MPGRRRTGSSPSSTSMSRAVYPASAPPPRAATLRLAFFGSGPPNRSLSLAFAADFNDLAMAFHVCAETARSESVALTMPCLGLKSDGQPPPLFTTGAGLCDLKSANALAYQGNQRGLRTFRDDGRFRALGRQFRARASALGCPDRPGAGVWRVAGLHFAAGSRLGRAGRHRGADRGFRHQLLAGVACRRAWRSAWRLGLLLVRLQVQGAGRAALALVEISRNP